jgi:CheY-like chemotaxis protein/anti-sigma regulatory factor (Ser/Thr protein kinase)
MCSSLIEAKGHALYLDVPTDSLVVDADSDRLTQVFANLLNNAAKYTEAGGEIRVCAQSVADNVVVTVQDSGIGIAPALLPRVFELFTQGTHTRERQLGGFGVGLAVSRKLVLAHAGHIRAESEGTGRGSRFIVTLPRTATSTRPSLSTAPAAPLSPQPRRVLVVDDNRDSAEMIEVVLTHRGHDVRIAFDGPTALEIAHGRELDIVLLDLGLPGMDGFEVARRLRKIPACASIPIIAVSGFARETDRKEALAAGFTDHFSKPIDLSRLEQLVDRADTRPRDR